MMGLTTSNDSIIIISIILVILIDATEGYMLKKVSALKARQNLGQIMNEVSIRGDDYVVERAGKPLVAIINLDKYNLLRADQEAARQALANIWQKMAGVDEKEVLEEIEEAIRETRKTEYAKIK